MLRIRSIDESAYINRLCTLKGAIQGIRWHNLLDEARNDLKDFYSKFKYIYVEEKRWLSQDVVFYVIFVREKKL